MYQIFFQKSGEVIKHLENIDKIMKIAFITFSFGNQYVDITSKMIRSVKKHLKNDGDVDLYVVSDSKFLEENMLIVNTPVNTDQLKLNKFKWTLSLKEKLSSYDLIYLIDADCIMIKDITIESILPKSKESLVCTTHPWQTTGDNRWLLEGNPSSTAYIENTNIYIQSCFWGGYSSEVLKAVKEIDSWIDEDKKNNIVSRWCEESYINKYVVGKNATYLDKTYAFPSKHYQEEKHKYDIKILHFNYFSCGYDLSVID